MHKTLSICLLTVLSVTAIAQDATAETTIRSKLDEIMPGMPIDTIEPTPVQGLYAVGSGSQVIYITDDGSYVIQGDMYDVKDTNNPENITENTRQVGAKRIMDTVSTDDMIIYKAPNEKTYITVFTDIDCTYCRALHKDVSKLNDAGITVRYLPFPRTPKGTESYNKAIYVWCAKDPNTALTQAKNGKTPEVANCKHPVDSTQILAQKMGVNVTPVIVLKNGRMIPGYLPPEKLTETVFKYGN